MNRLENGAHQAVLFDLDGTLVDTAPDMIRVLHSLQRDRGVSPVHYELGRSNVSNGAVGLLRIGFPGADDILLEELRLEYLERYSAGICLESTLFQGLESLLEVLETAGIPWGVVTNKPANLTDPLLQALQLDERIACSVSGDTLPLRKPHPAPLLHACEVASIEPQAAIYVGDASRDIEAGRAAGMSTVAAGYGYITDDDDPARWGADAIADDTKELAQIVLKAVNLDA